MNLKISRFLLSFATIVAMLFQVTGFNVAFAASSTYNSITTTAQSGILTAGTPGSATYTITVTRSGSGNLEITFSVPSTLPSGVTTSFSPTTVVFTGSTPTSATSTLTVNTTAVTPAGVMDFTVQGTDNTNPTSVTRTATGTLTVISIDNPVPTLSSISPTTTVRGGAGFTLTAYGSNFVNSSVVRWNGSDRTTTYASSTQISATIFISDITDATTSSITVFNPSPAGGTSSPVIFTVTKAIPVITWASPADLTYGSTTSVLTATQLNATSSVPGTFTYAPALATLLNALLGQLLSAHFIPTDSANYEAADATTSINVLKANQVITWASPAEITHGTALSATQLNATTTVPGPEVAGTLTYNPNLGTILAAGTSTLTVTVAGTSNYNEATSSVLIHVSPGPLGTTTTLLDLSTSEGPLVAPNFSSSNHDYTVSLPIGATNTPTTFATTTDTSATTTITNATNINSATTSDRTTTVVVTAEDTVATSTYTIVFNVTQPSHDATLSALSSAVGLLGQPFASSTTDYTVLLPFGATTTPAVFATTTDTTSTSTTTPPTTITATTTATTTVTVTAQDATTTKAYNIVFSVSANPSHDASLFALSTSKGVLFPTFASSTLDYTVLLHTGSGTSTPITFSTTTSPFAHATTTDALDIASTTSTSTRTTIVQVMAEDATTTSTYTIVFNIDKTAPVITILGSNPANLTVGDSYTDAGATSTDNAGNNITSSIASSSDVSIAAAGTYHVVYTVQDADYNASTLTRTVNVNNPTPTPTPPPSGGGGGGGGGAVFFFPPATTTTPTPGNNNPSGPFFEESGPTLLTLGGGVRDVTGGTGEGIVPTGGGIGTTTDLINNTSSVIDSSALAAAVGGTGFPWGKTLWISLLLLILILIAWYFYSRRNKDQM